MGEVVYLKIETMPVECGVCGHEWQMPVRMMLHFKERDEWFECPQGCHIHFLPEESCEKST